MRMLDTVGWIRQGHNVFFVWKKTRKNVTKARDVIYFMLLYVSKSGLSIVANFVRPSLRLSTCLLRQPVEVKLSNCRSQIWRHCSLGPGNLTVLFLSQPFPPLST